MQDSSSSITSVTQAQAPAIQTGPRAEEIDLRDAEVRSVALSKRSSRTREPAPLSSKRAWSLATASRKSLFPLRGYRRLTSTVTKPIQASPKRQRDRPVQAQAAFKSNITAMMGGMIKSSLNEFTSQSPSYPGGKEEPS